jgi:hypothetical protein
VRSKIHQEIDAAKSLFQRPGTKAMGADDTQEFTHCKDEQDKLLAPMAALQAKHTMEQSLLEHQLGVIKETLKRSEARESDLTKQLQQQQELLQRQVAEKSQLHRVHGREKLRLEHQLDVLQETLKGSEARESDLTKELQQQNLQVVQAQAQAQLGQQAQAQVQQPQMMQSTTDAGDFLRYTTLFM